MLPVIASQVTIKATVASSSPPPPAAGVDGGAAAEPDAAPAAQRYLTTIIINAGSWQELAALFVQHRSSFNHVHASAMLLQLARLSKQAGSADWLLRHSPAAGGGGQPHGSAPHRYSLTSSAASYSRDGTGAADVALAQSPLALAQQPPSQDGTRCTSTTSNSNALSEQPQAQASPAEAAPPLSPPTAEAWIAAARKFPVPQRLALAVAKEANTHISSMGMWELVCALRSLLVLGCVTDKPTVIRYMTRAFHVMSRATAAGLANLLWAVAKSGMQGLRVDWAARYYNEVSQHCGELTAQGVAMVLYSAAALQSIPPAELRQQLLERLLTLAEAGRCWAPDVAITFWSLAKLRTQPSAQLAERLLLVTQHQLPSFTAQELAMTLWGLAKLRVLPPASWCEAFTAAATDAMLLEKVPLLRSRSRGDGQDLQAHHGAAVLASDGSSSAAAGGDGSLNAPAPAAPPPVVTIGQRECAKALAVTLYSMALLQLRPKEQWLAACLQYTARHSSSFTAQVRFPWAWWGNFRGL